MSFKTKLWAILDVILRVPPIFVIDHIFQESLGFNKLKWTESTLEDVNKTLSIEINNLQIKANTNIFLSHIEEESLLINLDTKALLYVVFCSILLGAALSIFILNIKQLLTVYLWLVSASAIYFSYLWNKDFNEYLVTLEEKSTSLAYEIVIILNKTALLNFVRNYMFQMFLALAFCLSNSSFTDNPCRIVGITFITPTLFSILPIGTKFSSHVTLVSVSIAILYISSTVLFKSREIADMVYENFKWSRNVVRHYGLYTFLENQWVRLHVPHVLRVFWITRVMYQAIYLIINAASIEYKDHGMLTVSLDDIYTIIKELLIRGCETFIAVLGMTSIISSISHYIGYLMQTFLLIDDPEDRSIGTLSAILFFILALQTGLTGMTTGKRFLRLYRNICLLFTAILHFMHNTVNPLLLSLSASRNTSINKHGRALTVSIFLIAFPCWFLNYIWSSHPISTWLLAVSAFSIEVIIKVVISLMVYLLFMIDAYRNTFWEKLDDYVYYIKATGSTVEFIFGIFLFFNGAWILLFESGGTIRACMMCVHAYFNIWLQAKAGWIVFIKRRSAVNKINSLPEANEEQLRNFDDVCAICYQELNNARITRCNHFFHGVCLRKWLYVQDICPLCHKTLYNTDVQSMGDTAVQQQEPLQQHPHQD